MKKTVVGIIIILIAFLMASAMLTGCDRSESNSDHPDFIYVPDIMPIVMPQGIEWIDNVIVAGGSVYFSALPEADDGSDDVPSVTVFDIYSMNLDGSNMKKLPNYKIDIEYPDDTEFGNLQLQSLYIDNLGNIWVVERGEFFKHDLPADFDGDYIVLQASLWEKWNHRIVLMDFSRIRKLDNTGKEISSFDISHISAGSDWFHISDIIVDDSGNIYISVDSSSSVYVFDPQGNELFSLNVNWADKFVKMSDGSISHPDWREKGRVLVKIDVIGKQWGEIIDVPSIAHNTYQGNDEFKFLFYDNVGLYGVDSDSGETVLLVDWIDSDMTVQGLRNVDILQDERILIINQHWNSEGSQHELVFLTKTAYSELPERTVLTLATFHLNWNIRNIIVQFNRTSQTHRIRVIDYAEFNTEDDWQAGLTRLSAEIIAGNVPDILDVSELPFSRYAAQDLLIDLYPLIDSDPGLGRNDLMENVLRKTEINGNLYRIFPFYSIGTLAGNPSVVGNYPGWNMDEFTAVLNANPNADHVMGQGITKMNFLQILLMLNMDSFVDWNTNTVSFDGKDFTDLLMFADSFPDDYDWNGEYISEHVLIREGRQIMAAIGFNSFEEYQIYKVLFGGELTFKGFPNENRNGYSLMTNTSFAITNKCTDVTGAWEFLRIFLTEEWQNDNSWYGLPVNKNVFEKMLIDAMKENEFRSNEIGLDGITIEIEPLNQADVDQINALIDSISGSAGQDEALWNIISENAADYFSGRSSLEDAVRVIQNRASIYVAEQG